MRSSQVLIVRSIHAATVHHLAPQLTLSVTICVKNNTLYAVPEMLETTLFRKMREFDKDGNVSEDYKYAELLKAIAQIVHGLIT